ncbi:hypothetical protein EUX98_g1609 [Antrodiella citrinella]|uniref:Uncharacterized protein n=1 Tax=Antrodiella citrinella TaxID=2447956 RepID=A0A4S4N9F0_9APHY|nr:hypothetical protein EUX98_g1609 [Antrodiella citrinella]
MPSSFSGNTVAILTDATSGFRNNVRRMRSRTLWDQPRTITTNTNGKENLPYLRIATLPDVLVTTTTARNNRPSTTVNDDPHKWDPMNGKIILKVHVPVTDDIWRFKVPEDVSLATFHQKVEAKVGFPVVLGPSQMDTFSETQFQQWVGKRVKNGRNTPLTARPAWMDIRHSSPPL